MSTATKPKAAASGALPSLPSSERKVEPSDPEPVREAEDHDGPVTEPKTKYFMRRLGGAVVARVGHERERGEAGEEHAEHEEHHVARPGEHERPHGRETEQTVHGAFAVGIPRTSTRASMAVSAVVGESRITAHTLRSSTR